jgi:hypothetical protein
VTGFEENRVGRYLESLAIQIAKRLHDGGHKVGAAPDRLCQDDIGPFAFLQLANLADQVVESAAKAGPGHLLHGEALGTQTVGVHQVLGLIVCHQADLLTLV